MPLRWLSRSLELHRSARTLWRRRTTPPRPSTPLPRSRSRVDEASDLRTDNPQVLHAHVHGDASACPGRVDRSSTGPIIGRAADRYDLPRYGTSVAPFRPVFAEACRRTRARGTIAWLGVVAVTNGSNHSTISARQTTETKPPSLHQTQCDSDAMEAFDFAVGFVDVVVGCACGSPRARRGCHATRGTGGRTRCR